jgi:F-type H+-transporting ATPase subunit alpha
MKQVAGQLRMAMAQYRELEVFTKFGSEQDKSAQALLARGARMVEVLKQDQFRPLPIEKQVAIIYAGNEGYLDDVPVSEVSRYKQELFSFLDAQNQQVLADLRTKKELTDNLRQGLGAAISVFSREFAASLKES